MCDMDYFSYNNDISEENDLYGGDWYNWPAENTGGGTTSDPYSLANWGITDYNTPETSSWYSGLGKVASGLGSILTSPDAWKYGGLLGSILAATQSDGKTTTATTNTGGTSTPVYSTGTQAGIDEILNSALPYAQSNLLSSGMTSNTQDLYNYLMGGGGGNLDQLLNYGTEARNYLQGGLQDLDINNLISMVAPQITEATMKQFGPYAATKGGAQLATTKALSDKAAEFATQRANYQQTAANTLANTSTTQSNLLSQLLQLAQTPQTAQNTAYSSYLDTIRTLLGLPTGTTNTTGGTTKTATDTDIWAKLAPLFQGMSTTGTPTVAASTTNTAGLAALLKALGE